MKYAKALISNIQLKLGQFLKRKELTDFMPIDQALNDPTRRTYFSTVSDKNRQKYFLKTRLLDLAFDKRAFAKQITLGQILKKQPTLRLNQYTPKLIDSGLGEVDYLLYEYVEGENLGSRSGYAVAKFKESEVEEVVSIAAAVLELPVHLLPKDFEKRGKQYYQDFLIYGTAEKAVDPLLNIDWDLLESQACYFTHGDFKPNNFLRTKKGLIIVDLEQAAICNPLADAVRLWASMTGASNWREIFLREFLQNNKLKIESKLLQDMTLIHTVFERNYLKCKFPQMSSAYLQQREEDVKKARNNQRIFL